MTSKSPRPPSSPASPRPSISCVKPGHWTSATERMTANFDDFVGESHVSRRQRPERTLSRSTTRNSVLRSSRPVVLSKGRPKEIDSMFLVPHASGEMQLATELVERGFGATARPLPAPLTRMPSYQYHFVILAKEPNRYAFIKTLDSVKVPFNGESDADDTEATLPLSAPAAQDRPHAFRCPTTRSPGRASPTCCGTTSIRKPSRPSSSGRWSIGSTGAASSSSAAPIRSTLSRARSSNPTCRPRAAAAERLPPPTSPN